MANGNNTLPPSAVPDVVASTSGLGWDQPQLPTASPSVNLPPTLTPGAQPPPQMPSPPPGGAPTLPSPGSSSSPMSPDMTSGPMPGVLSSGDYTQPANRGGVVKNILTRMFYGMGQAGLAHVGLPTDYDMQRTAFNQRLQANELALKQQAQTWQQTLVPVTNPNTGVTGYYRPDAAKALMTAFAQGQSKENVAQINLGKQSLSQALATRINDVGNAGGDIGSDPVVQALSTGLMNQHFNVTQQGINNLLAANHLPNTPANFLWAHQQLEASKRAERVNVGIDAVTGLPTRSTTTYVTPGMPGAGGPGAVTTALSVPSAQPTPQAPTPTAPSTAAPTAAVPSAATTIPTARGVTPLSPAALDQAAENYWQTGQFPAAGRGQVLTLQNRAIMNRAAQLHPGENLAENKAAYAANKASLTKLQTQFDAVSAFENTARANIKLASDLADHIPDLGTRFANIPIRAISADMIGNENMAKFQTALNTAQNETARVLASATASGVQLTDKARADIQALQDGSLPVRSLRGVFQTQLQDMTNRHQAYQAQIDNIKARMGGGGAGGGTAGAGGSGKVQQWTRDAMGNPVPVK